MNHSIQISGLWPRKRGFEYVLLSVPGNSRVQRLHRQRCLRETPRSCSASGSFGLCNQRLSSVTTALRKEGKDVAIDVNHMVTLNLFTTITNANFDEVSIRTRVTETLKKTAELRAQLQDVSGFLKRPSGLHRKRTMQQRLPKSASFPNPMKISVLLRKPSPMASKVLLLIFIMQMS